MAGGQRIATICGVGVDVGTAYGKSKYSDRFGEQY